MVVPGKKNTTYILFLNLIFKFAEFKEIITIQIFKQETMAYNSELLSLLVIS